MKTITQKILILAFASFLLFSCATDDSDEILQTQEELVDIQLSYTNLESEIVNLINDYRSENGLSTLNVLNIVSFEAGTLSSFPDIMLV